MAKYISLVKYTGKGIENIKESPNRLDAFKQLCESMRAVEGFYLIMGRYDLLVIVDAPNSETIAKISLNATVQSKSWNRQKRLLKQPIKPSPTAKP